MHLGTRGSKAGQLITFLWDTEFEKLYLIVDLIDMRFLKYFGSLGLGLIQSEVEEFDAAVEVLDHRGESNPRIELFFQIGKQKECLSGFGRAGFH